MKKRTLIVALPLALALSGCLEVEQHPAWVKGQYAGKKDPRHFQTLFHNDKLSWGAAIVNRNNQQNEYNRANP
jgi:outer membrane lipoprotein SlyB